MALLPLGPSVASVGECNTLSAKAIRGVSRRHADTGLLADVYTPAVAVHPRYGSTSTLDFQHSKTVGAFSIDFHKVPRMEQKLVPREGAKAAWKIEFDNLCTQYNLGAAFNTTVPPSLSDYTYLPLIWTFILLNVCMLKRSTNGGNGPSLPT